MHLMVFYSVCVGDGGGNISTLQDFVTYESEQQTAFDYLVMELALTHLCVCSLGTRLVKLILVSEVKQPEPLQLTILRTAVSISPQRI